VIFSGLIAYISFAWRFLVPFNNMLKEAYPLLDVMDKKEVSKPMDGYTGKDIDIADLVDTAHLVSLEQLKTEIEDYQELLIHAMLNRGYMKAGSYMKTIVTTLGVIAFKVEEA
jgi:hypothetical protein